MPHATAEHVGGPGIEVDRDVVVAGAGDGGKAAAEVIVEIKILALLEVVWLQFWPGNAVQGELANVGSVDIPADEIPAVVAAEDGVWMDMA